MTRRILLLLALGVMAVAVLLAQQMTASRDRVYEVEVRHHRMDVLADELRQTSDDLTRMVRTYAATGDRRYAEYFQQILDIRNGEAPRPVASHRIYWDLVVAGRSPGETTDPVALRTLMEEAGFTAEELAWLQRSEDESNRLVALETRAMRAMEGPGEGAEADDPAADAPDRELALELLHGDEYHTAKAAIMAPLQSLFKEMEMRMTAEAEAQRNTANTLALILNTLLIAVFLLLIAILATDWRAKRAAATD